MTKQEFIKKYESQNGKIKSDTWSLGGKRCGYNGCHIISPQSPLTDFEELETLLEETCPNITFLQYKKVHRNSVEIEEENDADWYGGSELIAFYVCDLGLLYDDLKELGLIE